MIFVYSVLAILGLAVVALLIVFWGKPFLSAARCPKCGGGMSAAYLVNDDRTDLYICDTCETLYRDIHGEMFEVFGHPPLEGGNDGQRPTD